MITRADIRASIACCDRTRAELDEMVAAHRQWFRDHAPREHDIRIGAAREWFPRPTNEVAT